MNGKAGRLAIDVELSKLGPASKFGPQYLTYVLWAITPEGRAINLGEIVPDENGKSSIDVTTDLQAFGLIVTAEPYFAVTRPSNEVVAENIIRQETKGFEEADRRQVRHARRRVSTPLMCRLSNFPRQRPTANPA